MYFYDAGLVSPSVAYWVDIKRTIFEFGPLLC